MPIYEYKCKKCGKEFEIFQGITDQPVQTCQSCGGSVNKLMSLSTFHLKGSGWYVTDYGGKKAPVTEKSESTASAAPVSETAESAKGPDSTPAKASE
jgi:putative FmdB family regulatory protein